eukprot:gene28817-25243_t
MLDEIYAGSTPSTARGGGGGHSAAAADDTYLAPGESVAFNADSEGSVYLAPGANAFDGNAVGAGSEQYAAPPPVVPTRGAHTTAGPDSSGDEYLTVSNLDVLGADAPAMSNVADAEAMYDLAAGGSGGVQRASSSGRPAEGEAMYELARGSNSAPAVINVADTEAGESGSDTDIEI